MKIRVGMGFDVHKLEPGEAFFLGGVEVEHYKGAVGHSDADVLLHAITDAILGAANLRDIGFHFPDTDQAYKGADSKILLTDAYKLVKAKGFHIGNIDCTICLELPKLKPYIEAMKIAIAGCLELDVEDVSIKATTTEKLSFVGREEGVSAYAVCLLQG